MEQTETAVIESFVSCIMYFTHTSPAGWEQAEMESLI